MVSARNDSGHAELMAFEDENAARTCAADHAERGDVVTMKNLNPEAPETITPAPGQIKRSAVEEADSMA